ncbi:MAG TPA: glucose-6-phosphate isomerase [Anaerolineales bacterium]|nr:glucose-6-phosphate isomerase [Anaerolineales bacterium]
MNRDKIGILLDAVNQRIATLNTDSVPARLFVNDPALWTQDPAGQEEIKIRLGWLKLPETSRELAKEAMQFSKEIKDAGIKKVLLLGMGGSSLGPETMGLTFNIPSSSFSILDSTDPAQVAEARKNFPPAETLYIVASKSGGTAETMSAYYYFWEESREDGSRFVAITDPDSNLEKMAIERKFRKIFRADSTVGGRYSALTAFGLVPASLMGIDADKALDAAEKVMNDTEDALFLGALMGEAFLAGRDKLTLITDSAFESFGAWAEQLIAESTGKDGKGIVPIDGEAHLPADKYGDDRYFIYLRQNGEYDDFTKELVEQNHPVYEIQLLTPYSLFAEFYRWEYATAIACHILGVNAFDQPNVESAKIEARAQITAYNEGGVLDEGEATWVGEDVQIRTNVDIAGASLNFALDSFLALGQKGDYVSIHAYLPRNRATFESLQKIRKNIQEKTGLATTLGFGPRFLHSTGQLHKGGANNGLFIQITVDVENDIEIPTQGMSFGTLERAQVLGDYAALVGAGRRVMRIHFNEIEKMVILEE